MNARTNNYALQQEYARVEYLKWDQSDMIARFGLRHDDAFLYVTFFNREYRVCRATGEVTRCEDGAPAGFEATMTIYDMLCQNGSSGGSADGGVGSGNRGMALSGKTPSGEWKTLANLSPHSSFGAGKTTFGADARRFSGKTSQLRDACLSLGGFEATKADVGFLFNAFPSLPVIFQFWDGDDEFEPRVNILFDANALDCIHYETAWYLAGYLIKLIEANL
jgi:hypothetical protein